MNDSKEIEARNGGGDWSKEPPPHPQEVETPEEKRVRMWSIRIVQVAMLIFSIGFSIILTGVFPYMKQLTPNADERTLLSRYGWVVSANPLGQMLAAPFFGWLNQKSFGSVRLVGIFTSIMYILGNILYSLLSLFPEGDIRFWMLLLSRFIVGVSSGNTATIRSYVASATFTAERTSEMSIISSFQSLGFTIGPGIQAALTPLQCTNVNSKGDQYVSFDMYTSAGWASALLGVISFVLFLPFFFNESDVSGKERQYARDCKQIKQGTDEVGEDITENVLPNPDYLAALVCVLTFFTFVFNFVLIETLGTPMCMDQFGWTEEETVLYFGILISSTGVMCVFLFAIVGPLSKRFDERKLLIFIGISTMFLGRLVVFPIPGNDPPPIANDTQNLGLRHPMSTIVSGSPNWYYPGQHRAPSQYLSSYENFLKALPRTAGNIPCDEASTSSPGCHLEWCKTTPAVTIWQLFGGIIIGTIGYPFAVAITQSTFSKIIGPRPQGLWMGFLSAFGSLSRVLGPIFVSYIYTNFGTYPVMGFMVGSLVIALILTLTTYKRLVPMNFGGQNTQQTNSAAAASADARQPRLPEQPLERYRRLNSVTSSSM